MWLEFDLASATTPGAVSPRLFIDLDPTFARTSPRETICDAALQIVQMLTGAPVPSALSEHLHTCCTRLPAGAVIPYIGVSQDGPMPVVRVCMTGLAHELRSYLSALSWPGDVDDLDGRILTPLGRTFGERERHVSILHLDLKPEPSPRIGLEYAFAKDCQRNGLLRETAVLDHLVSRGWCGRALRDELPGWPGRAVAQFAHEIWHSRVTRHVSHIKLAYATGERIDAKIYLAFFFALVRGNSARLLSSRASPRLAARGER
jgi:hypothetical protein